MAVDKWSSIRVLWSKNRKIIADIDGNKKKKESFNMFFSCNICRC